MTFERKISKDHLKPYLMVLNCTYAVLGNEKKTVHITKKHTFKTDAGL
jgi:hypothetical protein